MSYVIVLLLGMLAGGISVFAVLEARRRNLREQRHQLEAQAKHLEQAIPELKAKEQELEQHSTRLRARQAEFEARAVSYAELQDENTILKRDLQNIDVNLRKVQLDGDLQREQQEALDRRGNELGSRFLKDNIRWIGTSLNPNNFANCRQRLQKVIEWCRGIGFDISGEDEGKHLADLKADYEKVVRSDLEREEQVRIKAQIREEQRLEKEIERELQQLEREREAIQVALEKALAETKDEHSAEVQRLKERLAEAEQKAERTKSRAEMTKSGHVYVISNIGSFGEGVFKIGLTRRLEPKDRVRELGDASVPFPFDVHMMVSSDDAPALENALHRTLHKLRVNKVNPRKEFFRTDIGAVREIVEACHGEVQYVADPEALEYRQSLEMSDEDLEFIESVYDEAEDESTNGVASL